MLLEQSVSQDQYNKTGNHKCGKDVSSFRYDELDYAALAKCEQIVKESKSNNVGSHENITVFDLGCGHGSMTVSFAEIGADAFAFDLHPHQKLYNNDLLKSEHIVKTDIRNVNWGSFPHPKIVYSQRTLHYIRYDELCALLSSLIEFKLPIYFYLSFSGMNSELSIGYQKASLKNRFSYLSDEMAVKHDIHEPVCLYYPEDIYQLASLNNLKVEKLWVSEFGNVKTILYYAGGEA